MWMTAKEAAERLGVKPSTVYTYISRGMLRSERTYGRDSRVRRDDVERAAARGRRTAKSHRLEGISFESAISLTDAGGLYYRGHNAATLARTWSFEEVAALLWNAEVPAGHWRTLPELRDCMTACQSCLSFDALPLDRITVLTAMLGCNDTRRYRRDRRTTFEVAASLIASLANGLTLDRDPDRGPDRGGTPGGEDAGAPPAVATVITRNLVAVPERLHDADYAARLESAINGALVMLADHGLATPTLVSRLSASISLDFYGAMLAGFSAMRGYPPGAASLQVEHMLTEAARIGARAALRERLRRSEVIPGFGHAVYPSGDPRGRFLLQWLGEQLRGADGLGLIDEILAHGRNFGLPEPNVDFGIAALCYIGGLRYGSAEAMFSISRIAGWTAHFIEETDNLQVRDRIQGVYTGPGPA